MTRKEFLEMSACAAAATAWRWDGVAATAGDEIVKHDAPPRNRRPYAGVDWSRAHQIRTTTHGHCDNQNMLNAYLKRGFEFLTVSNYYPSAPRFPLADVHAYDFRMKHDFPVVVKGKRLDGPFDWTAIVSAWKDELPEEQRKQLPFTRGKKLFKPLPPGMLEAPNAEHHYFLDRAAKKVVRGLHLCSPGSVFASGTFDKRNRFKTHSKGWCYGSGEPWPIAVDRMLAGLIDPKGGGVTINHPTWSKMDYDFPAEMLDYDPRILGMEVINGRYFSEDYWDYTLKSGRQCYGFFVPDWSLWRGCNVLLVKERTVSACLRAYREGNFYGALHGGGVKFTHLSYDGRTLEAATDAPVTFELISAQGKIVEKTDKALSFKVPATAQKHVYFRLKALATDASGEILYSQPFMV
jgi:hypothetical protein